MKIETIKYSDGDGSICHVEMKMEFEPCDWYEFQHLKLYRDLMDFAVKQQNENNQIDPNKGKD